MSNSVDGAQRPARSWARLCPVALAWLLLHPALVGAANPGAAPAVGGPLAATQAEVEPADLTIGNRRIFTLRATNEFGAEPTARSKGIEQRLQGMLELGGPLEVASRDMGAYVAVVVDGHMIFRILSTDADPESSQTMYDVAEEAVGNLRLAIRDLRESRDSQALAAATGKSLAATAVLAFALWLLVRAYRWLAGRVRRALARRTADLVPDWGTQVLSRATLAEVSILPLKLLAWGLALLLVYEWTALVLHFFPYTRPWGETLGANLAASLTEFGGAALRALPGLLFVALIFFITRFVARLVRAFFDGVQVGRIQVSWVDETTARPTGKLLIAIIWLFAFVAAYPYIPGSDSEAFKGIGVFVGLMMSIGASGVVNQAVSGLMLMYTKALRPGEFVQIGETEGTVKTVGFLTTRIETLRNVEVAIPNAVIAGNVTRNYSRLAGQGGMRLGTSVTIGYDTPWRQVRALLLLAVSRTHGLLPEPPPRVAQTALQDFYVEYTLLVSVPDPRSKLVVLDELHGHIQDVFNEHGVQIMSPNYEADPATPKVVPREQWYAAPAVSDADPAGSAAGAARSAAAVPE